MDYEHRYQCSFPNIYVVWLALSNDISCSVIQVPITENELIRRPSFSPKKHSQSIRKAFLCNDGCFRDCIWLLKLILYKAFTKPFTNVFMTINGTSVRSKLSVQVFRILIPINWCQRRGQSLTLKELTIAMVILVILIAIVATMYC